MPRTPQLPQAISVHLQITNDMNVNILSFQLALLKVLINFTGLKPGKHAGADENQPPCGVCVPARLGAWGDRPSLSQLRKGANS